MTLTEKLDKAFELLEAIPGCTDNTCHSCDLKEAVKTSKALVLPKRVYDELLTGELTGKLALVTVFVLGIEIGEQLKEVEKNAIGSL
jgi:hypothetical protein